MIRSSRSPVELRVMRRGISREDVSDEALLGAMALGDEAAGLVFVRRYQRRLYGLALGIVGDVGDAEDAVQEALIRIFRHAAVFDPRRGSASTWALAITRNASIDATRTRRGLPVDPHDRIFLELTSPQRPPEVAAIASETAARLSSALALLPLDQRRAVVLAALYGRTAAEIAEVEGIPVGTAKGRVRLGMAKLRQVAVTEETP